MSKVLAPQRGTEKLEEQALEILVRGKRDTALLALQCRRMRKKNHDLGHPLTLLTLVGSQQCEVHPPLCCYLTLHVHKFL